MPLMTRDTRDLRGRNDSLGRGAGADDAGALPPFPAFVEEGEMVGLISIPAYVVKAQLSELADGRKRPLEGN